MFLKLFFWKFVTQTPLYKTYQSMAFNILAFITCKKYEKFLKCGCLDTE